MDMQKKVTKDEALQAVRTLLQWIGENPDREGLINTPTRVIESYDEYFSGYMQDPVQVLGISFEEVANYNDIIILKDIRFESFCEHHWAPIVGFVNIAYVPNKKVVGISKLARLVNVFAKRLQIQERMTAQIAQAIFDILNAKGVAVVVEAEHYCMTTRGIRNHLSKMRTQSFLGELQNINKMVFG